MYPSLLKVGLLRRIVDPNPKTKLYRLESKGLSVRTNLSLERMVKEFRKQINKQINK